MNQIEAFYWLLWGIAAAAWLVFTINTVGDWLERRRGRAMKRELERELASLRSAWWEGARPGEAFDVDQGACEQVLGNAAEKERMREQLAEYTKNLRRYLALTGVSVQDIGKVKCKQCNRWPAVYDGLCSTCRPDDRPYSPLQKCVNCGAPGATTVRNDIPFCSECSPACCMMQRPRMDVPPPRG